MAASRANRPVPKASTVSREALLVEQWKREVEANYLPRLCASLERLSEQEIWWRANEASNSMGNLVLHLCGNVRQWIISGLGGADDVRQRDLEFSEKGPIPRDVLLERLRGTVSEATKVIAGLSRGDLVRHYAIQGIPAAGWDIPARIAAHFAYHAGQVVYFTKMRRGEDLGFTKLPVMSWSARPNKTTKNKVAKKKR